MPADHSHAFAVNRELLKWAVDVLADGKLAMRINGTCAEVPDLPPSLPWNGLGEIAALEELAPWFIGGSAPLSDPGVFAHMDPPTPWITWAASMWTASLNQNLLHPETAPVARQAESLVVNWLAPLFGMDGGHMTPGATIGNLTALWAARDLRQVEEVIASSAAHISIRKAAHLLGLRFLAVDADERGRIGDQSLDGLDLSRAALVLTAGTTSTGSIDDLKLDTNARWLHVDAAWAGPMRLSPLHTFALNGIERADSVVVSGHKWLFQPKESALVFFADTEASHRALSFGAQYLSVPNIGVQGSHGAAALPLLATLLAWGRQGVAAQIEHCISLAGELAGRVAEQSALELFGPPQSGIVIWRPRHLQAGAVRRNLTSSSVSLTTLDGLEWFRSVSANPMARPSLIIDDVLQAIERS